MSLGQAGAGVGAAGKAVGRAATKLAVGGMRFLVLGVERAPETAKHNPPTTITALANGHLRKPRVAPLGFDVATATSGVTEREGAATTAI